MRKKRIWTLLAWSLAVVLVLVLGKVTGLLSPVEWVGQKIISPAQAGFYRLGIAWFGGQEQVSKKDVEQENQVLKGQINTLLVENTRLLTALSEVGELQHQLEKISGVGASGIPAKVIGRGLNGDQNAVEINAGSQDGVVEGSAVLSEDGILVGRVSRVDTASSIVTLLTSPSIVIAAEIQNDSLSPGVVSGEHGLALRMTLIPQTDEVKQNQVVITSGTDDRIPQELVIGTITNVTSTPGGLFQEATITPLFDPQNVRVVTVVIK
ncbi:MAG: rod shape-determining protein MreC [Patescibacteria group bacterium]